MERDEKKIRKLRDDAEKARQANQVKKAKELYHQLCDADPGEPRWPQQAGEMHRKLGEIQDALEHFCLAAELFQKSGFSVKAVAICKVVLAIDSDNATCQQILAQVSGPPAPAHPVAAPPPRPVAPVVPPAPVALPVPVPLPVVAAPGLAPLAAGRRAVPQQTLELSLGDLQDVLEPAPAAARPPERTPAPPEAPFRPAAPVAARPPERTPDRPTAPRAPSLDAIPIELDLSGPPPELERGQAPVRHEESQMAFMEALDAGVSIATQLPSNPSRPFLAKDAALDSLALHEIIPSKQRGRTGQHPDEDIFEVQLGDDDSVIEDRPDDGVYRRAMTPGRLTPNLAPPGLFKSLGIDAMMSLVTRMEFRAWDAGQTIITQDEPGQSMFVIVKGEVSITRLTPAGPVEISRMRDGEFFGEMGIITDGPRLASVVAVTDVEALEITRETMRLMVQDFPQVVPNLIRFLKDRLLEVFVKTSPLLKLVPDAKRWQLAKKFKLFEVSDGKVLVKQGRPSGGLFIFLAGKAHAFQERRGRKRQVADLGPGDMAGEISLLGGGMAEATVVAAAKCWLLVISERQFATLMQAFPEMRNYLNELAEERRRRNEAILADDPTRVSQSLRTL